MVDQKTPEAINPSWFHDILETINDAVIVINSAGLVIYWNNTAKKIFGYSSDEMLGQVLAKIMPEKYRKLHASSMQSASDDHSDHNHKVIGKVVELIGLHKNGTEFPIEMSLAEKKSKINSILVPLLEMSPNAIKF